MRMSNSQQCQGQRSISPCRVRRYSPGSGDFQPAQHFAATERRALMRAAVDQREELVIDVEDADLAPL